MSSGSGAFNVAAYAGLFPNRSPLSVGAGCVRIAELLRERRGSRNRAQVRFLLAGTRRPVQPAQLTMCALEQTGERSVRSSNISA